MLSQRDYGPFPLMARNLAAVHDENLCMWGCRRGKMKQTMCAKAGENDGA